MAKGLMREEERNNRAVERDKHKRKEKKKYKKTYVVKLRKNVFIIKHFRQYMYEFDVHL